MKKLLLGWSFKAALRKRTSTVTSSPLLVVMVGAIAGAAFDLCVDYLPSPLDRDLGQTVGTDPKLATNS